ncbi:MAG: prepilin peptidase [Balneolales bacterium]|nr:prepilin peptidase [Balneolales bacterium]
MSVFLGSYIVFYFPKVLSQHVTELDSVHSKTWGFVLTVIISVFWIWFSAPSTPGEYMYVGAELLLIQIAAIDSYSRIIPNRVLLLLLVLFSGIVWTGLPYTNYLPVILIATGVLAFQVVFKALFRKYPFGWGDIKLVLVLTLFYGKETLWILWLAVVLGGLFSILLIIKDRTNKEVRVPFAPFLAAGVLIRSKIEYEYVILMLNPL